MSEAEEEYDMIFKIVIVGDSGVGKTNILLRYLKNEFDTQTKATVGVEFGTKKTRIENSLIKAQIWDTAGQERYRSITSAYYKGAHGALVVYDITRKSSFDSVEKWLSDLKNNGSLITSVSRNNLAEGGIIEKLYSQLSPLDLLSNKNDKYQGNFFTCLNVNTDMSNITVDDLNSRAEYVRIITYDNEPCIELGESDSSFKLSTSSLSNFLIKIAYAIHNSIKSAKNI